MPDEISHAAPTEEIAPEAEVQETTTEEVSPPAEPPKEKPLTTDDYRQIAREEAMRIAQSQMAKGENRINQRIQERFEALEANKGVLKLTEEQVTTAQQQIINEEQMNAFKTKANGQQASSPETAPSEDQFRQNVSAVYTEINAVIADVGVELSESDPEFKILDKALSDPNGSYAKTILAASKAAETKAARTKAQKENANARVTGGGGTTSDNNISGITDAKELYRLGEKKIGEKK